MGSFKSISFGEWLPDQPEFGNPGATEVNNVIPSTQGYRPFKDTTTYASGTTDNTPLGAGAYNQADSNFLIAGDTAKLYRLSASTLDWDDVSKTGGYSTSSEGMWKFAVYGDYFIATNFSDYPQFYQMSVGGNFADLTTALRAKHIAVVRDFVVAGNTWDSADEEVTYRVRWSALDDPSDWTVSATTQSDFQDLSGGGDIMGIVGGEYGTIIMRKAIWRMTYVGSPLIWQFDEIEQNRGAVVPESIANVGPNVFFIDEDGFYVTNGGEPARSIGNEKVNRWFYDNIDENYWHKMSTTIDTENKLVVWSFVSTAAAGETPDKVIIYNYALNKWSKGDADIELLVSLVTIGTSMEALDSITPDLDSLTVSLDAYRWKGGKSLFAALSTTGNVLKFDGDPQDATIETGEQQLAAPFRAFVNAATPLIDGGTLTANLASKNKQNDTATFGSASTQDDDGACHFRDDNRYHKFRANITGTWDNAQGFLVEYSQTGGK